MITQDTQKELQEKLTGIAPVVRVQLSTLGGVDRASLLLLISLDPRESWENNILENSRYARFSVYRKIYKSRKGNIVDGFEVEHFSGSFSYSNIPTLKTERLTFRKAKVETLDQVANKIKEYVAKFPKYEAEADYLLSIVNKPRSQY
jgi:hypothetical protein